MNTNKILSKIRILLLSAAFLLVLVNVKAQEQAVPHHPPPVPNAEELNIMMQELEKDLSLDQNQSLALKKVFDQHFSQIRKVQEKNKIQHEANKEKMDAMKEALDIDIKKILGDEKFIKLEKITKERESRHEHRRNAPPPHKMNR